MQGSKMRFLQRTKGIALLDKLILTLSIKNQCASISLNQKILALIINLFIKTDQKRILNYI